MTKLLISAIAAQLGLELRGNDLAVTGVNTLELAGPEEISFLANSRYISKLASTQAGAVIVSQEYANEVKCALISKNPYQDFGRVLSLFAKPQGSLSGVSELAFIHPEAQIDVSATIYPFAYIGPRTNIGANCTIFSGCYIGEDCVVGKNTLLYPNITIMARTQVGENCIIHAGAVLGSDGFGFSRVGESIEKIPQIGVVRIGNNVEIGANTTIDRAVLDVTVVDDGTKIDNLVQVAHNVRIGKRSLIVSQVGISGSTTVGDECTLAGQVGLSGHLNIGDRVTIGPQSGVARDIAAGQTVGGSPAVEQGVFMRTLANMPKLPDLFKRVSKLERQLADLTQQKKQE
jgi:UDP-3-O-[3-hydroxymyristoyl] glucosamine N-acyltransferase